MAIIKSYTDLEQSKKLAEILPIESADMFYTTNYSDWEGKIIGLLDVPLYIGSNGFVDTEMGEIYAWSLAALLDILSRCAECVNEAGIAELSYEKILQWCVSMLNCGKIKDCYADNPVDACVAMVEKLYELNLL